MTGAAEASTALSIDEAASLLEIADGDGIADVLSDEAEAVEPEAGEEDEGVDADEADAGFGPQWWPKEAKARFAELPPDLQAVVLDQEQKREAVTAKVKQEAFEVRQRAASERAEVQEFAETLTEFLPAAVETFRRQWEEVDWDLALERLGPEEASRLQEGFEAERAQLAQLAAVQAEAARRSHLAYLAAEEEKLAGTELADKGRRGEVARYLLEGGVAPEQLGGISALELTIAHKAMLWDRAQAGLKVSKAAPAAAKPVVRPAAGSTNVSPQARRAQAARARFAQSRSIEDAIALLDSKG